MQRIVFLLAVCVGWPGSAAGLDRVLFRRDGKETAVEGRKLVVSQQWGLVVLGRDGVIWRIPPDQQIKHTSDDTPFRPFTAEEMARRLLADLPPGFETYRTPHYLILYDTSKAYAQWCGSLFELLYKVFTNYWSNRGLNLQEPEFPLVAIVFADQRAYCKYARPDLGAAAESMVGYFHLDSNRMVMYDLTGAEKINRQKRRVSTSAAINQILARPEALTAVSTIIHEATHQVTFNCGVQPRHLACPLWLSEGIAIYFETPDLKNPTASKGWAGIGKISQGRLTQFHDYLRSRPSSSLKSLITADERFRDPKQALDAYAEAWALTYHLIKHCPKQYVAYIKALAQRDPLAEESAEVRLRQFEEVFGDWKQLDRELLRSLTRLR